MSQNPTRNRRYVRLGITLIEVVAGLALLGTLLTMMLVAAGKLERQLRVSESKLNAVAQLDRLISGFFSNGFPNLPSNGPLDQNGKAWAWRLDKLNRQAFDGCSVVRLSIVDMENSAPDDSGFANTLAKVDILVSNAEFGRNVAMGVRP